MVFPLIVALRRRRDEEAEDRAADPPALGIVTAAKDGQLVLYRAGSNQPQTLASSAPSSRPKADEAPAGSSPRPPKTCATPTPPA